MRSLCVAAVFILGALAPTHSFAEYNCSLLLNRGFGFDITTNRSQLSYVRESLLGKYPYVLGVDKAALLFLSEKPLAHAEGSFESKIAELWLDTSKPPAKSDKVTLASDKLISSKIKSQKVFLCCELAEKYFWQVALKPATLPKSENPPSPQKYTRIDIKGVGPIGVLKHEGENTFLATRNVINSKGDLIVAKGAIYQIPKKDYLKTTTIFNSRKRKLLLESIDLIPLRFTTPSSKDFPHHAPELIPDMSNNNISSKEYKSAQFKRWFEAIDALQLRLEAEQSK